MSEAPDSSDQSKSPEASSGFMDAEWTDDSSYQNLDETTPSQESTTSAEADEWDEATFEWEEELNEPPEKAPQPTTTREALSWIQPTWRRFRQIWRRLIAGIRRRIPAAAKLSDTVLSIILVGVLGVLLLLLNSVRQPAAAGFSQPQEAPPTIVATQEDSAVKAVDREDSATPASATAEPSVPEEAPATAVASDRIANIQKQMTDGSILNAQRVIDSVQADFVSNRISLVFNGDWYRLSDYDQTQLAQALMEQSESLSFTDLQLVSAEGDLLARSPVVGNEMIILQRERPPEVPMPERPRFRLMIDR